MYYWVSERMSCCKECRKKPWPYLIALTFSIAIAYMTWLTMGVTDLSRMTRYWISVSAFLVFGSVMLGYLLCCISRHCDEDNHHR